MQPVLSCPSLQKMPEVVFSMAYNGEYWNMEKKKRVRTGWGEGEKPFVKVEGLAKEH